MTEQYFEMLWDCPQCSTPDLLAKTHRHCPTCGAAQDPQKRHFPKPGQEVEAGGHRFVGADWVCGYCETPNAAAGTFCVNCGGPQEGTKTVKLVSDQPPTPAPAAPPGAPPAAPAGARQRGFPWFKLMIGLLLAALLGLAALFFSKHDEGVQLVEKTWTREVNVEQFSSVRGSDWCDAMPSDAYQVSRTREQRSTRQIKDGQDCVDVRADMGDGTFTKRRECTPRYRSEPVFDNKCSYRINRWQLLRTERLAGGANLAPAWPAPQLVASPVNTFLGASPLGQQRLGGRREAYQVSLQSPKGRTWRCELDAAQWQTLREGQTINVKVRGTGGLDCASLGSAAPGAR